MKAEMLSMSTREQARSEVISLHIAGHIDKKEVSVRMGLCTRQARRVLKSYALNGASALVHGNRGKVSNRKLKADFKADIMVLVHRLYADFGPTFAVEKLAKEHALVVSVETLRQWMIGNGLWQANSKKTKRHHPSRERRPCVGELIQIDGSPHDWFEGRAEKCTLIVFIDDATSQLMDLQFYPTEGTQAYMEGLRRYMQQFGRPVALYSDRHSTFTVNQPDALSGEQITQFGRALKTLDIDHIPANSPQAKGRVERANLTLQDRLVKEMRLAGIANMDEGNAFLQQYMQEHNQKFAVKPASDVNAHRPVIHDDDALNIIFSKHYKRKISKGLAIQYNNVQYQIHIQGIGYNMHKAALTVCEDFQGNVVLLYKGKPLQYTTFKRGEKLTPPASEKTINQAVDQAIRKQKLKPKYKPATDHPWRKPTHPDKPKRSFLNSRTEDISTLC